MSKTHEGFWTWFVEHETELHSLDCDHEAEREAVFDELASALENVHPELTFEFGLIAEKREFVIRAAGYQRRLPARCLRQKPILKTNALSLLYLRFLTNWSLVLNEGATNHQNGVDDRNFQLRCFDPSVPQQTDNPLPAPSGDAEDSPGNPRYSAAAAQ